MKKEMPTLPMTKVNHILRDIGKGNLEDWGDNVADALQEAYADGYEDGIDEGKRQTE